jgi:A/G-specific adenine glycosylase
MVNLINWYLKNKRNLPWRGSKNPYEIWLSEIILQQTRVDQGLFYYQKFIDAYPTVFNLAKESLDEILLLWQGLGYYSRARNLHITAKDIVINHSGKFPDDINGLKKLKGIGDYTAAAIASIAFGIPEAVVDGNVYRVLSRYFSESTPIDSTAGKHRFKLFAGEVLNRARPGLHNEAIMELGATVCLPAKPKCSECPLSDSCIAFNQNSVKSFPVKNGRTKQRNRYLYFFIIEYKKAFFIEKRIKSDIWKGLYQFPCIEKEFSIDLEKIKPMFEGGFHVLEADYQITGVSDEYKHVLSHQIIKGKFIHISLKKSVHNFNYEIIPKENINKYAMPRLITRYLEENSI